MLGWLDFNSNKTHILMSHLLQLYCTDEAEMKSLRYEGQRSRLLHRHTRFSGCTGSSGDLLLSCSPRYPEIFERICRDRGKDAKVHDKQCNDRKRNQSRAQEGRSAYSWGFNAREGGSCFWGDLLLGGRMNA
jgi:hypothetical protein